MADDRRAERLVPYVQALTDVERPGIEAITLDRWDPYRQTVREQVPDGERKCVYLVQNIETLAHQGDAA